MTILTEKQVEVLSFIRAFFYKEDRLPSSREMKDFFGWRSQTAAISYLEVLCKKGYLEHRKDSSVKKGWYRFNRKP